MRGLRTQENEKFRRYFELVQAQAGKQNAVFFTDCAEGKLFVDDVYECEDLFGWLIPLELVSAFEKLYMENAEEQENYDDYYCLADYEVQSGAIQVFFRRYPLYV